MVAFKLNPPLKGKRIIGNKAVTEIEMASVIHQIATQAVDAKIALADLLKPSQSHRHLVRGDVSIVHPCVTVFLKWSKTMQANTDSRIIPGSPLCPLLAIMQINQAHPVPDHCPLFSYMSKGKLVIISQSQGRLVLAQT